MHFWIDKRSQACGFGRARVAASLSNSGGAGLGFGHYPPRRSKSMSMSAPIHRLQSQDFARPTYLQHQQNQQQQQQQLLHQQQQQNNSNCNNNISNNNNNQYGINNNRNSRTNNNSRQYESQYHHNNIQCYQPQSNLPAQQHQTQFTLQNCENQLYNSSGIRNQQLNSNIHPSYNTSSINNNVRSNPINTNNNNTNGPNNYHHHHHVSVPMPNIYGGSSQSGHDLEQGTMGSINNTRNHHHQQQLDNNHHQQHNNIIENHETQLLPAHLKCGMWASLIVATICVAGVKFYYDHQRTGLEVFIFITFLSIFFSAACTVSLCPCPKKLPNPTSPIIINNNRNDIDDGNDDDDGVDNHNNNGILIRNHHLLQNHTQIFTDNNNPDQLNQDIQLLSVVTSSSAAAAAPPPPYHIAILLPDTSIIKEYIEFDETPPPSYDKILI